MVLLNNARQFGTIAKTFHWLIAFAIIAMLAIGFLSTYHFMHTYRFSLITLHKSLGLTILLLMMLRLCWRLYNLPPSYPLTMSGLQQFLAHGLHWLLYVSVFAIIMIGWSMSGFDGHKTAFWGWFDSTLPLPLNHALEAIGGSLHLILAWVIIGLLTVHISAALWHHFVQKDTILKRMLPFGRGQS